MANTVLQALEYIHHSGIGAIFVTDFLVTGVAYRDPKKSKLYLKEIEKVATSIESNMLK